MLRVLDLFSGIGGFSLGLERTGGFQTVAFCEIDPYCRQVLARHWPEVPCYDDIRTVTAARLAADGIGETISLAHARCGVKEKQRHSDQMPIEWHSEERPANPIGRPSGHDGAGIDVICGGFPCQDISTAGKGAGIDGTRSGLWAEMARVIGEVRPQYAIVENVAALLGRGLSRVLGDLAALGFDAEWHCIPAAAVGAPHRRDRIWIVAQPACEPCGSGRQGRPIGVGEGLSEQALADANQPRLAIGQELELLGQRAAAERSGWWKSEPEVGRVAHGVPRRVDRLRALGNAVVPQIPELIGRAILAAAA